MSERDEYIENAKARLDNWNADIDRLNAKAAEATADAKIEYQKQLDELRRQRDAAEEKIEELRQVGDDAWQDMKTGFDKAFDSIGQAFEKAMSRYK